MRRVLMTVSATALTATGAFAGGIERSTQSVAILFEQGNYVEFTLGEVSPNVSGVQQVPLTTPAGSSSGDMAGDYTTWSLAVKTAITDKLNFALILDEPIGADVDYKTGTGYSYGGSTAAIDSHALTAMLRYKLDGGFSVIGGLRAQQSEGEVALFNGYTMDTSKELDYGYLVGVAWEKPEIAARVSLTYNSAIDHDFRTTENPGAGPDIPGTMEVTSPQSLNLEAQTGIAADTLLFGSVRWVDWSEFVIAPPVYENNFGNLVDYDGDTITYSIGLGRRFNETWSGAITASYEDAIGGYSGNLGPTDGATSVGLATTYTSGPMKITGGVRYVWLGDTETEAPSPYPAGTTFGKFKDNEGVAVGLRVGYSF